MNSGNPELSNFRNKEENTCIILVILKIDIDFDLDHHLTI